MLGHAQRSHGLVLPTCSCVLETAKQRTVVAAADAVEIGLVGIHAAERELDLLGDFKHAGKRVVDRVGVLEWPLALAAGVADARVCPQRVAECRVRLLAF